MDYHNEYSNQFLSYNAQDSFYDDRHAQFNYPQFSFQECNWCLENHHWSECPINYAPPPPQLVSNHYVGEQSYSSWGYKDEYVYGDYYNQVQEEPSSFDKLRSFLLRSNQEYA